MGKAIMRLDLEMLRQRLALPDNVEIVSCQRDWRALAHDSVLLLLHSPRLPDAVPGEKLAEVQATFEGSVEDPRFLKFQTVGDEHSG